MDRRATVLTIATFLLVLGTPACGESIPEPTARATDTALPVATTEPAPSPTAPPTATPRPPEATPTPEPVEPTPTPEPPAATATPPPAEPTRVPGQVTDPTPEPGEKPGPTIQITELNKRDEYVDIYNAGDQAKDLTGWKLVSERGDQTCQLGGVINPGETLRIWAMAEDADQGGYNCAFDTNIWNNSKSDPAALYDAAGRLVDRFED